MNEIDLEKILEEYLLDHSLEDFFEEFNQTPLEIVELAYNEGYLDDDILSRLRPVD